MSSPWPFASDPDTRQDFCVALPSSATVDQIPGLNILGLSLARVDYKFWGLSPPHIHPRATEIVFVLERELEVGFITTANKYISQTIKEGQVFVFPRGMLHYVTNVGDKPASQLVAFNSQKPGVLFMDLALFTATPTVSDDVLSQTFCIGTQQFEKIKTKIAPKKT